MNTNKTNSRFHGFEIIHTDRIDEYCVSGVWAMFGIRKGDVSKKYVCLNVGKNKNIGEELKIDLERLKGIKHREPKEYRNQFNEMKFLYLVQPTRLDYLYDEIAKKYEKIIYIIVARQAENTYTIEKYFAYSTKAEYWVSNGRYAPKTVVTDAKIQEIKNGIDMQFIDESLKKKIDKLAKEIELQ